MKKLVNAVPTFQLMFPFLCVQKSLSFTSTSAPTAAPPVVYPPSIAHDQWLNNSRFTIMKPVDYNMPVSVLPVSLSPVQLFAPSDFSLIVLRQLKVILLSQGVNKCFPEEELFI